MADQGGHFAAVHAHRARHRRCILLCKACVCPEGRQTRTHKWPPCTKRRSPRRWSAVSGACICSCRHEQQHTAAAATLLAVLPPWLSDSSRLAAPAANCGTTQHLLKCSRCHNAWFCGVKCQKVGGLTPASPRRGHGCQRHAPRSSELPNPCSLDGWPRLAGLLALP